MHNNKFNQNSNHIYVKNMIWNYNVSLWWTHEINYPIRSAFHFHEHNFDTRKLARVMLKMPSTFSITCKIEERNYNYCHHMKINVHTCMWSIKRCRAPQKYAHNWGILKVESITFTQGASTWMFVKDSALRWILLFHFYWPFLFGVGCTVQLVQCQFCSCGGSDSAWIRSDHHDLCGNYLRTVFLFLF